MSDIKRMIQDCQTDIEVYRETIAASEEND